MTEMGKHVCYVMRREGIGERADGDRVSELRRIPCAAIKPHIVPEPSVLNRDSVRAAIVPPIFNHGAKGPQGIRSSNQAEYCHEQENGTPQ